MILGYNYVNSILIFLLVIITFVIIFYSNYQEHFESKEIDDIKKTVGKEIKKVGSTTESILNNAMSNVKGVVNSFAARFGSVEGFKSSYDDDDDDNVEEVQIKKTPININISVAPNYQPSRPTTAPHQLQSGNECPYCNSQPCQCQSSADNTTPSIQTLGKPSTTLGSSNAEPSTLGNAPYTLPNAYSYINQLPAPSNIQPSPKPAPVPHPAPSPIEPPEIEPSASSSLTPTAAAFSTGASSMPTRETMSNMYSTGSEYNTPPTPVNNASEYNQTMSPEMYKDPKYMKFLKTLGNVPIDAIGNYCPSIFNDTKEGQKKSDTIMNETIARSPPRIDHSERTKIYKSDQIHAPKIYQLL